MSRNPLHDQTFVFTGEMSMEREDAKFQVIRLGGRCTTAPSSRTTYLVAGSMPGEAKMKKAGELGIAILNEDEFRRLIDRSSVGFDDTTVVSKGTRRTYDRKGDNTMWSEKYRPRDRSELVGNPGIVAQLEEFLLGKTGFKAALLSGHPGVGKTTAAQVVCRELGLEAVEFNASDTRNKSELDRRVRGLIDTYALGPKSLMKRRVLIMDEIDGMTSDRGGIPELTSIIKSSRHPIICICNDRSNPKIRTLSNYCLDLRFRKLESRQIIPRLKWILEREGKQMPDSVINELIVSSNGDMRYILNTLQNLALHRTLSAEQATAFVRKNVMKGLFDIAVEVFQRKSVDEKIDLYFEEYSLIPLFVSENLYKVQFKSPMEMFESSESISRGDVVEKYIRGATQEWGLAPLHALYSVVIPTHMKMLTKRIDFPGWLGQNSKYGKSRRIAMRVLSHASAHMKTDVGELRKYGMEVLCGRYIDSLGRGDIDGCLRVLEEYDLTKDDLQELIEVLPGGAERFKAIKTKNKSDLTRNYKKMKRTLPYVEDEEKAGEEESTEI
jgi:replication factor C subunit 1